MSIDRERQLGARYFELLSRKLDMRDHPESVHARIRPARTVQARPAGKQLGQCLFDHGLNSKPDRLDLPALVVGSVVRDSELDLDQRHVLNVPEASLASQQ